MTEESLEAAIRRVGNPVDLLRNLDAQITTIGSIPGEFSNWREEARSWQRSCAFLDQSHHMTDLFIRGPGLRDLLSDVAVNSFANFGNDKAKQIVAVNHDGHFIGDAIIFGIADDEADVVGRRTIHDWLEFYAGKGNYDVEFRRDVPTPKRGGMPPELYRYELQGPATAAIMETLIGGRLPEVRFFNMTTFQIGGHRVRALRHGMAGEVGFELFGPWPEADAVRDLILAAGEPFGIVPVGAKAYMMANLESGWIPGPMPAIFGEDELYREFRESVSVETVGTLGGSLYGEIGEYYVTPYDLDYGRTIKFDHDFIGRDALLAMADEPHRHKVTLIWDADDVARVMRSHFTDGPTYRYLDLPKCRYAAFHTDEVLSGDARVGISMDCGITVNAPAIISLAVVDESVAEPGTQVSVLWGEDPLSAKPLIEPHEQTEIRATVAPCPLAEYARDSYRTVAG